MIKLNENRNYGIDLLRMVCMLMVVLTHVLGQAGAAALGPLFSPKYLITRTLYSVILCAVDCYALITGYMSVGRRHRFSSFAMLWLRVLFYSVLFFIAFAVISPEEVTQSYVRAAFLPTFTWHYWYYSSYVIVFLLLPFITAGAEKMSFRRMSLTVAVLLLATSVAPFIFHIDTYRVHDGYSALWLVVMCFLGVYLRRFDVLRRLSAPASLLCALASVCVTLAVRLAATQSAVLSFMGVASYETQYTTPSVVATAVFLLSFFEKLRLSDGVKKAVALLSPSAFGVYLIHTNKVVWTNVLKGSLTAIKDLPAPAYLGALLGAALAIYAVCTAVDLCRELLFSSLKLKGRLTRLEDRYLPGA